MSISNEIEKLQDNLANSYTAVENKGGTIPENQCFDNLSDAIGSITELKGETRSVSLTDSSGQTFTPSNGKNGITSITITPNNQARTITPTTSQQTIDIGSGYSGNGTITVNAVDASIDSDISAANIVLGKNILGVDGSATVLNGETKSVSLTNSAGQTFTPSNGKNAITSITVTPNNQARTVTPTTSQQTIGIGSGYSGNGTITVNAVDSTIDSNISATNIVSGKSILGVNGSATVLNGQTKTVNPTTSQQTITPDSPKNGLTSVTVNAVMASIDSNIQAKFIRNGIEILDITGTYGEPIPMQLSFGIFSTGYLLENDFYLCGYNAAGQQGNGTTTDVTVFTKKPFSITQIFCSDSTTGFITEYGSLFLCGKNNYGQQGNGTTSTIKSSTLRVQNNVAQLFLSNDTSGYINTSGDLYLCGNGANGQQGLATTGYVGTFTKRGENAAQLFLTTTSSGYVTTSGDFYLCGDNTYGQQGSGNTTTVRTFTKIAENVSKIFLTTTSSGYVTTSGDFYLCGDNTYGQQGNGTTGSATYVTTFTKIAENVSKIFLTESTSGYVTTSGDFYLCGRNQKRQQGYGTTSVSSFTKRGENAAQIFLTESTSGYVTTSGDFYLCGANGSGQQGSGNTNTVTTFTKRGENVAQIFLTNGKSGYFTTSGDFYLCGDNTYGHQGNGTTSGYVTTFTKRN